MILSVVSQIMNPVGWRDVAGLLGACGVLVMVGIFINRITTVESKVDKHVYDKSLHTSDKLMTIMERIEEKLDGVILDNKEDHRELWSSIRDIEKGVNGQ